MPINNNLYPPIVQSALPAFLNTEPCRIYFSLSVYNSEKDIKNVQVSLIKQKTNTTALIEPSGILITELKKDESIKNEYKYYVQINPNELIEQEFEINEFYKVQLRFTSVLAEEAPSLGIAAWLYNNLAYFSEWSDVCLIKGIDEPQVFIHNFIENTEISFNTSLININGKIFFNNSKEQEFLKLYKIRLYQGERLIADSDNISTNRFNPNEFNYSLNQWLPSGILYTLYFTYETNNGYKKTKTYFFSIIQPIEEALDATIKATPENENGRIKIKIQFKTSITGGFTIRRTSSDSNFHKWEDVRSFSYNEDKKAAFIWYDVTAESGIWYHYCIQRRSQKGDRGAIVKTNEPVMCLYDHIFLTRENCQLKIQFDPSLNSFKYNVTESQQVTLGSKFPFIKRNGNNYYRTFPIGGTISSLMDSLEWDDMYYSNGSFRHDSTSLFASRESLYGTSKELYDNYNEEHGIHQHQDYIYERKFREKVYDFLYKNDVKLFKSTTEGNILIKLMDINFQPMQSLGRRLYSFSATAIEIDEVNIFNCNKYGIQSIGDYSQADSSIENYDILGQISGKFSSKNGDLISTILQKKYQQKIETNYEVSIEKLKWIRMEFISPPYIVTEGENGTLIKANESVDINTSTSGYIVKINDKEILIHPSIQRRTVNPITGEAKIANVGFFEINSDITALEIKYEAEVIIDYIARINKSKKDQRTQRIEYSYKLGQLYGSFNSEESLIRKIYKKYLINFNSYSQKVIDITGIKVEGPTNGVIYVKDSKDSNLNRHILENGFLELNDDGAFIEGLYFHGVHLIEADPKQRRSLVKDTEFIRVPGNYSYLQEIQNPIQNGVYKLSYLIVEHAIGFNENGISSVNIELDNVVQENNEDYSLVVEEDSLSEVNHVYYLRSTGGVLDVMPSDVLLEADLNYSLLLARVYENPVKEYIWYHGQWRVFTADHDVICPIDGIVDYICKIEKVVYDI